MYTYELYQNGTPKMSANVPDEAGSLGNFGNEDPRTVKTQGFSEWYPYYADPKIGFRI